MHPKTFRELQQAVDSKITEDIRSEIVSYVVANEPKLWGASKPRGFVETAVLLALYKDLEMVDYQRILATIQLDFKVSFSSFRANTRKLRLVFKEWAKTVIKLGSLPTWKAAARHLDVLPDMSAGCLWIDSSDFSLQNTTTRLKSHPNYSHKNGRLGRRFMFLSDANGIIKKIWGGYSPKVYDGHFLELNTSWFAKKLKGAGVFGDFHFSNGKTLLKKKVDFYVPFPKPANFSKRDSGADFRKLTKEQQKWNARVAHLRARVEQTFAWLKTKFRCLAKPWAEDSAQLDCVLWLACGIYNKTKQGL